MLTFLFLVDTFAQAGGGGSSSGGSGGGGGAAVIALLGYFPSYYLGKLIKKLLPRTAELIVSAAFAVIFTIVLLIIGFILGSGGVLLMGLIAFGIWAGWAAAFFGVWDRLRKKSVKARALVKQASASSSAWNETELLEHAKATFQQYQNDWSAYNLAHMATYMTPYYAQHAGLLLAVLKELGRRNVVSNVEIKQMLIIDAHDDTNDTQDRVVVAFEAVALTELVENDTNTVLFTSKKPFTEYWRFKRSGEAWLLDGIDQSTSSKAMLDESVVRFATNNAMFYSLDMGWLFLPKRGLLMNNGRFGSSDINNHTVGVYNGRLVQLYTFVPVPYAKQPVNWLVLQITLPKAYDGIIVRPKRGFWSSGNAIRIPKNYTKYTYEWPAFNDRYEVYATAADRLASFELINPGFMAYLYDNDPGVHIEVADNTLYLYKEASLYMRNTTTDSEYQKMLTIALKAFKELKL